MTVVYFAVEGETDVPVAERLIRFFGLDPQPTRTAGGKSRLDARIPEMNRSGVAINWLILRDLDHDAPCASALIRRLLARKRLAPKVLLRVPIRAVESWMLADVTGFAVEFATAEPRLPDRPDDLDDPKQGLIEACRYSVQRAIREAMVPRPGSGRKVGPEYTSRLVSFARRTWSPERAAQRSPSLRRTLTALRKMVTNGNWERDRTEPAAARRDGLRG